VTPVEPKWPPDQNGSARPRPGPDPMAEDTAHECHPSHEDQDPVVVKHLGAPVRPLGGSHRKEATTFLPTPPQGGGA